MFYVFPRAIPKKECKRLTKYCLKHSNFEKASVINKGYTDSDPEPMMIDDRARNDPKVRKTNISWVKDKDNEVNAIAWHYLREANKINFKYKLDYFQPIQFGQYKDGGHYDWHQDASGQNPHGESRKLSLVIPLTDPSTFEGGKLEFYGGDRPMEDLDLGDGNVVPAEQIKKDIATQGSVIVFDSRDFHRVTPVTKGVRYSIVCWTVGPNFV
jgi:PKHD-type hydroxylase